MNSRQNEWKTKHNYSQQCRKPNNKEELFQVGRENKDNQQRSGDGTGDWPLQAAVDAGNGTISSMGWGKITAILEFSYSVTLAVKNESKMKTFFRITNTELAVSRLPLNAIWKNVF